MAKGKAMHSWEHRLFIGAQRSRTLSLFFALCAVVGFGLFQGARILDLGSGPYSAEPYAVYGIATGGLVCLYVALLSYMGRLERVSSLFAVGVACIVLRIILAYVGEGIQWAQLCAQIAAGAGWALMTLSWMQIFASYRPLWSLFMIPLGFALDVILVPAVSAFIPAGETASFAVPFIISFALLGICIAGNSFIGHTMKGASGPVVSLQELQSYVKHALFGAFAFSCACGFVVQADIDLGLRYAQTSVTALFGIIASVGICLAVAVLRPNRLNMYEAHPVITAVLMVTFFARSAFDSQVIWSGSLMVALLMTFFCLLWMAFVGEAHERMLPGFFLLGIAVGTSQLSVACGRVFASVVPPGAAVLTAPLCLLGISVVVQYLVRQRCARSEDTTVNFAMPEEQRDEERIPDEQGATPCANQGDAEGVQGGLAIVAEAPELQQRLVGEPVLPDKMSLNEEALNHLCEVFSLSERERQIIAEFSTGRSARYIADYFMLSEHTVKTHLKRAYAKMDVHSRQELLDRIALSEKDILCRNR